MNSSKFKPYFMALLLALLTIQVSPQASADVLKVRENAPQRYVVKKGDTLWDLSAIYLEKPWLWPKLWRWNPQIKNPHLIYPGDVLSLTYDSEGNPRLTVNSKVIKLSPKIRTIRKSEQAIPTLPLRIIRPYISYGQSLEGEYLDSLPYVMGATSNSKSWLKGQKVYVSEPLNSEQSYAIYRKGQAYVDPQSEQIIGYETALVATAKVVREGDTQGNPATLLVTSSFTEIKAGDKILPANVGQMQPVFFKISEPKGAIDATIIASPSQYREYSKYDIVVINKGHNAEAKVGNMLDIYHRSPTVVNDPDDPKYLEDASRFSKIVGSVFGESTDGTGTVQRMPKEKIGEMMIFKVYDNLSYAFVTTAKRPIRVGDTTASPQ